MLTSKNKTCLLSVKDVDDTKGVVKFYAASFDDKKDSDGDIIHPGTFKKTLSENGNRLKHLYNHYKTIGVVQDAKEDSKGLLITSKLSKSTAGQDALTEYKEGIITEHSIGFKPVVEAYDDDTNTNHIKEVKLWEVSSLDKWGANENTPTVGVKSYKDLVQTLKSIDHILHNTNISDEGAIKLLKYSKRIHLYIKSLPANKKPSADTSIKAEPVLVDFEYMNKNFKLTGS